jgi:uncharacterized protein (DUF736 family)
MSTQKNSTLDAIMAQYEEATKKPERKTPRKEYDTKNYFATYLPKGTDNAEIKIRILPPTEEGTSPFKVLHAHHVQVGDGWKKIICNAKNDLGPDHDDRCPYCEAYEALRNSPDEADRELAKKYRARKFYVVKLIQRGKEDEGVKFWRFKHDFRNAGILDKIVPLIKYAGTDIFDPEKGKDLIIFLGRDQNGYTTVKQIMLDQESILSQDSEIKNEWLNDTRTWHDVYSIKRPDYLEILVKGGEPVWSKDVGGFVDKNTQEDETNDTSKVIEDPMNGVEIIGNTTMEPSTTTTSIGDLDDENDDLPF